MKFLLILSAVIFVLFVKILYDSYKDAKETPEDFENESMEELKRKTDIWKSKTNRQ